MQRSFDDPTTPLRDVTFCVLDLETTGGSPQADAITEIGAVKVRGGECLGTFHTLVNPGLPVPDLVTVLTGITESMLAPAPPVHEVLPALGEFVGGAVLVGHNVRFDASFLDAALAAHGRPRLGVHRIDTAALARRLLRDEAANNKLGTLAERFRLDHRPNHRALDDALATVDLLHLLLERAASFGVGALDDLLALPALAGHPHAAKLRLTSRLPRSPGVYLFRDRQGRALYVGRALDLRTRVRSLFASTDGRTIGPLLRQAHTLDHVVCSSALEAGVLEARLLGQLTPRYNRHGTRSRSYRYVGFTRERFPRLTVVRAPRRDGGPYLGPFVSTRAARLVVDAIEAVVPLRRCSGSSARPGSRSEPCAPAQQGLTTCPCSGQVDEAEYGRLTEQVARGLSDRPDELLDPLRRRMEQLLREHRPDDATAVRDMGTALARALRRQRRFEALRSAGRVVLDLGGGAGAELVRGRLVRAWGPSASPRPPRPSPPPHQPGPDATDATSGAGGFEVVLVGSARGTGDVTATVPSGRGARAGWAEAALDVAEVPSAEGPVPCELADELHYVAAWLDRYAGRVRLVEVEGAFSSRLPAVLPFDAERQLATV
jgi:DNA polymerase-3 subunit epsilon